MKKPTSFHPLVSICVPVFNSEKTIKRTIASIIGQTYTNIEIIIVDNHSTDTTLKIVEGFGDPRIRIVQHEVHLPVAEYNWNRCFQYANGEYMAIFHSDDVYSPMMVESQINTFMKNSALGGVFTSGNIINEKDEIIREFQIPTEIKEGFPYNYKYILTCVLEHADFLPCPTAMIQTKLYSALAPFRYEQFGSASDLDMWLRLSECGSITILKQKLINYRISGSQGTSVINFLRTREADIFRVLDFHLAQNNISLEIPIKSIEIYELFRFEDNLGRARNYLIKNDLEGFRSLVRSISWAQNISIALAYPKRYRNIFPKLFQLLFAFLIFSFFGVMLMRKVCMEPGERKHFYERF
jgi:glycosyltransferase involved in cell wall biosynthesis